MPRFNEDVRCDHSPPPASSDRIGRSGASSDFRMSSGSNLASMSSGGGGGGGVGGSGSSGLGNNSSGLMGSSGNNGSSGGRMRSPTDPRRYSYSPGIKSHSSSSHRNSDNYEHSSYSASYHSQSSMVPSSHHHSTHRVPYKILCVANLNPKVPEGTIRDALFREFSRFGEVKVKIAYDNNELIAYVYFRCYEDAREARHAKTRMILFEKQLDITPIHDRTNNMASSSSMISNVPQIASSSRSRRSLTPDGYSGTSSSGLLPPPVPSSHRNSARMQSPPHSSSRSSRSSVPLPPIVRMNMERYAAQYGPSSSSSSRNSYGDHASHSSSSYHHSNHHSQSSSHHRDYGNVDHYHHHDRSSSTSGNVSRSSAMLPASSSSSSNMASSSNLNSSSSSSGTNRGSGQQRESKKEKFPNYLHHIAPEEDDKATRTLFVGNLEVTISESDLRRIFEKYGHVEDIDVKRPPPGQGNAYAFIKFFNLDMAHRAKVEMSGQYIGKFQCKIGYGKATPTTRIWVGGLGPWTSLAVLEREFDRFGAIRKIDFVKGENHAYIQYDSIDAAQAACQEMRGFPLGGQDKRLRVDFADPGPYNFPHGSSPSPSRVTPRPGEDHDVPGSGGGGDVKRSTNPFDSSSPFDSNTPARVRSHRSGDFYEDANGNTTSGNNGSNTYWSDECPGGEGRSKRNIRAEPLADETHSPVKKTRRSNELFADEVNYDPSRGIIVSDSVTTIPELVKCCPTLWVGSLILKSSCFALKMLLVAGNHGLVDLFMRNCSCVSSVAGKSSGSVAGAASSDHNATSSSSNVNTAGTPAGPGPGAGASSAPPSNGEVLTGSSAEESSCNVLSSVTSGPSVTASINTSSSASSSPSMPILKITQRLRLDQSKLLDVTRRMSSAGSNGFCILLAIASPSASASSAASSATSKLLSDEGGDIQQRPFKNLVTYLKTKQAAGVISLTAPATSAAAAAAAAASSSSSSASSSAACPAATSATAASASAADESVSPSTGNSSNNVSIVNNSAVLYAFPPCDFSHDLLKKIAPNCNSNAAVNSKEDYMVVVVVRGSSSSSVSS